MEIGNFITVCQNGFITVFQNGYIVFQGTQEEYITWFTQPTKI